MEQAIEEIAASGCRSIEPAYIKGYLDFDEEAFSAASGRDLARRIASAGLAANAVSAHMDLSNPDSARMLRRRIGFAATLGARFLITNSGRRNSRNQIVSLLRAVSAECRAAGIKLALENPGHGSGDLIGNAREGTLLIDELGSPDVGLNYDIGNVFTYSREAKRPEADLCDRTDRIIHCHLKDVASIGNDWTFTAIGDGSIDYKAVWAHLPASLPVTIELPLRLERFGRSEPTRRSSPVSLEHIRLSLSRSLVFVAGLD
ncbi:MAG: sugar phosphate isomerase/epimerase [Rhizobiaceae bacterium]|nr:sugar phosphate isomerase/epimerase [Rhizobiaceae bacterium]